MNITIATKPHNVELNPWAILSAPRLGPINLSSIISIGAANEPARSKRATSAASVVVMLPEIWTLPPGISALITGAVTTSPEPFSISRIASLLPIFCLVISLNTLVPFGSKVKWTAGSKGFWESNPACASVKFCPVIKTSFFKAIVSPSLFFINSTSGGIFFSAIFVLVSGVSSTNLTSKDAVLPSISLALAVSWTPGNWTTIRFRPCCCTIGSATPNSFIRLERVTIFCLRAVSSNRVLVFSVSTPLSLSISATGSWPAHWMSGISDAKISRVFVKSAVFFNLMLRDVSAIDISVYLILFFLRIDRVSVATFSSFVEMTAPWSISNIKCTPPLKSNPRYIGSALIAANQFGTSETRFNAIT